MAPRPSADHRAARHAWTLTRVYEPDVERCAAALVWLLESRPTIPDATPVAEREAASR